MSRNAGNAIPAARRSPRGERGLKCHAYAGLDVDVDSHSPQGEYGLK